MYRDSPEKQSIEYIYMYICINIVIKNWFIELWRLIIPNIVRVNWQAGGPRESITKFQSESEGPRTRRTDNIVPV